GGEFLDAREDFLDAHLRAAMKRIRRVAPRAPQIASREAHEYARQACARALPLNRPENLADYHVTGGSPARLCGAGAAGRGRPRQRSPHPLPQSEMAPARSRATEERRSSRAPLQSRAEK